MNLLGARGDNAYMDQALALAVQGRGTTSPNPMVGAVVVSALGAVVGTGFHARAGDEHAEVRALREAGNSARGATLYCTLEPCCHQGRTGACAPRVVSAGIRRVVVAMVDPNPLVGGGGIDYLRALGVEVQVGVRSAAAHRLNTAFETWVVRGRPFVTMKVAVSLDGRITARVGERTQLTSEAATKMVHQLRDEVDAIGVGSTTVLVDDPLLTARGGVRKRPLTRVVFDRRLRIPPTARLFDTLTEGPVVVLTTHQMLTAHPERAAAVRAAGARVEAVREGDIGAAAMRLGELEITTLLLEGGTDVHRAAWSAGVVDRVQIFITPTVLGSDGVEWFSESESWMADLHHVRVCSYDPDLLIEGDVYRTD